MTGLVAQVASYHSTKLEFTESDPFFHKCLQKQSACQGAYFYTPVTMEVIGTTDSNYLVVCKLGTTNLVVEWQENVVM